MCYETKLPLRWYKVVGNVLKTLLFVLFFSFFPEGELQVKIDLKRGTLKDT